MSRSTSSSPRSRRATGRARARTLQASGDKIPASDRGLAFALAGDPVTAIDILGPAAREATATAKTRQNLALSLALAGRWKQANEIAAMDVAPDKLQERMMEWARFSRPTNAYDQVASLLNVVPVQDGGQPVALALSQQPNVAVAAVAPADPVDAYMPGVPQGAEQVVAEAPRRSRRRTRMPAPEVQPEPHRSPAPVRRSCSARAPKWSSRSASPSAAPAPVAARAPVRVARASAPAAAPVAAAKAKPGNYYVQLGAYANAEVARDGWARHASRVPALRGETPQGVKFSTGAGNFYRLSVGGFDRAGAAIAVPSGTRERQLLLRPRRRRRQPRRLGQGQRRAQVAAR